MKEETINDRMEMLINERFDGNKSAFAKAVGLSPNGINSYIGKQRRSKPSIDVVLNIIEGLGVDPMWLLTGKEAAHTEVHTEGDFSPASVNGNVSIGGELELLREKVVMLERLLEEKERTIKILMER